MPLLKQGRIAEDDFVEVADDADLPEGPVIVSAARLPSVEAPRLGVRLANTIDVTTLANHLPRLEVVVLEFPKFGDGRAYSQARTLRERLGFTGEVRATGQVLPDQILLMRRCGFDAFVLAKGDPLAAWALSETSFSGVYQPAADGARPAFVRRRDPAREA